MAYHSGCGGEQFGDQRPHTYNWYNLTDIIRQISIDYSESFLYTDYRTNVCLEGGCGMSTHEAELFMIINENDNPEQAVLTAIEVFTAFLKPLEASPEQQPAFPQESA